MADQDPSQTNDPTAAPSAVLNWGSLDPDDTPGVLGSANQIRALQANMGIDPGVQAQTLPAVPSFDPGPNPLDANGQDIYANYVPDPGTVLGSPSQIVALCQSLGIQIPSSAAPQNPLFGAPILGAPAGVNMSEYGGPYGNGLGEPKMDYPPAPQLGVDLGNLGVGQNTPGSYPLSASATPSEPPRPNGLDPLIESRVAENNQKLGFKPGDDEYLHPDNMKP